MNFTLPQTSLVPTIVEIISFINKNWPDIWWYPHWYLGVPLRFITGPIVPLITLIIGKVTSQNIGVSYAILIALSMLLGIIGFQKLLKALGGGKNIIRLSTLFYLLLPINFFLFSFGNGLHHITSFLLPWPLYFYLRLLEKEGGPDTPKSQYYLTTVATLVSISILFMIDFGVVLPLIIGMFAIFANAKKNDQTLVAIVRSIALLLCAFSISVIWYSPGYFWTVLGNPSFGGRPLSNVIPMVLKLLQALLPVVIGVWVVQKKVTVKSRLTYFAILFGASFLVLTLIRMASDIDFWIDWSSYGLELQFVGAILLGLTFRRYIKRQIIILFSICILTIIDLFVGYKLFFQTADFDFKQHITTMVGQNTNESQRWFLSGSPVFWLPTNQTSALHQVRGGKDSVSIHPTWAMGAYQIREGKNAELTSAWLEALGVTHALVHTDKSQEYFHDFKQVEKFELFEKISTSDTDRIYTTGFDIARNADPTLLELSSPKNGEDKSVVRYADLLGAPARMTSLSPSALQIESENLEQDELVWLSHKYNKNWTIVEGKGQLKKDSFGNTLLIPYDGSTRWILKYKEQWGSWVFGIFLFGLSALLLISSKWLATLVLQKIPSLGVQEEDEHDNY